jgi:hypothetical protein
MKLQRQSLHVAALLALSTLFASPALSTWEVGTLVTTGFVGEYCDARIDGSGDLHVVYFRTDTDEVYAISRLTGVWQSPQIVDPDGNADRYCSISATGAGVLRFAWRRGGTNSLMFAGPERADQWLIGDVISGPDLIADNFSLYQSDAGTLSVACRNDTQKSLLFIKRDGAGVWAPPDTVDPGPNRGMHCDHTWRPGGGYAFSQRDEIVDMLLYADPVLKSGDWEVGGVTSGPDFIAGNFSLYQSDAGTLSVACRNDTQESLLFIKRDGGGAWAPPDTVDPGPNRGGHCDHTWRPGGGYAFSQRDENVDMLLYADPVLKSGDWTTGIVRATGDAGQYVSASLMPDGKVACTYFHFDEAAKGAVHAAFNVGTADFWVIRSVVDSVATYQSAIVQPDIAVVSGWQGFVAYRNDLDEYLYCAVNDSVVTGIGDVVPPGAGGPLAFALYHNYPNPFNPTTTISYGLKETGRVSLRIYDVAGRLVKTLVDGVRLAGDHEVTWDGRSDRGSEVATGVYFVQLISAGQTRTHKIVLVK